jgi:hypothetical protein
VEVLYRRRQIFYTRKHSVKSVKCLYHLRVIHNFSSSQTSKNYHSEWVLPFSAAASSCLASSSSSPCIIFYLSFMFSNSFPPLIFLSSSLLSTSFHSYLLICLSSLFSLYILVFSITKTRFKLLNVKLYF